MPSTDVRAEVAGLIESLGELSPVGRVMAALAESLAEDIDNPPRTATGTASIAPYVNSLRTTITLLVEKGHLDAVDDDAGADGWADIAASAGATPIRDAPESPARDVGGRGRRGGASAG